MGRLAVIDGVRFDPEQATVSVYDRGFLYGDSVFETVRTYRGEPFLLAEHMERLARSARSLGIDLPLSEEEFIAEVDGAVRAAGNAESFVRIMLSRGRGPLGLDSALAKEPLRVVLVEPLQLPLPSQYRDGISVVCIATVRMADAARSAKLANYLASVLALRQARAQGADEALVVNREGFVVEGTTSNLFAVQLRDSHCPLLCTPPLEAGVLAGITRSIVLEVGMEQGLEVAQRALRPAEVRQAAELFLTSSVREIMPVVRVDDTVVGSGRPGPWTRRIVEAFRARVGMADAPLPWEGVAKPGGSDKD